MRLVVLASTAAVVLLLLFIAVRRRRVAAQEFAEADRLSAARAITSAARHSDVPREAGE